jgi:hypothetical protein
MNWPADRRNPKARQFLAFFIAISSVEVPSGFPLPPCGQATARGGAMAADRAP